MIDRETGIGKSLNNKIKKKLYNEIIKPGEQFYYTDNNKNEWKFTEINGTKNHFYFKCSTHICKGLGKIERPKEKKNNNKFELTKTQNISYNEHT